MKPLGVGVLGLHEGRTLLVGLSHTVPDHVGRSRPLAKGETGRSVYAKAVAGCDLDPAKREATSRDCPGLFVTEDFSAMLDRTDVEIVAIYTPDHLHAEHIIQAFAAGKHVICTKPLVNTMEGARQVLQAARQYNRRLLVGQSTRFFEPFLHQKARVHEIGQVEFADAQYCHRMDWYYEKSPWAATETDWVFLGLSHPLDLLRWHLGPIAEVQAMSSRSGLGEHFRVVGPDIYSVQVRAESGALGRAFGHYGLHELPRARNAIELMLYGDEGTSLAQYHDMKLTTTRKDGTEVVEDYLYGQRGRYFNNEVHGMHYGEFANYADLFARSILEDTETSPELEEGIEVFCLMEAVRRSAESGQKVALAPLYQEAGLR